MSDPISRAQLREHAERWRGEATAALPRMLEQIGALVDIPSGTALVDGVTRVCEKFAEMLADQGFEVRRVPIPGAVDGVDAVRVFTSDGPRVTLVGHADTVGNDAALARGLARVEDPEHGDVLRGDGVGDMKSALIVAIHALRLATETGDPRGRVRVVLVTDEQLGSPGSRSWLERCARESDVCLGLEAGGLDDDVVVSRGAVGAIVAQAHGAAAHVTEPGGISALDPLMQIAGALQDSDADGQLSVGILHAGTARQVVPAHVEMHIDLRAPDDASAAQLAAHVRTLADDGSRDGVQIDLAGGVTRPAFPAERSAALFDLAAEVAGGMGWRLSSRQERGGSDASFFAAAGVTTLDGLGPVCGNNCAPDEFVRVASIAPRTALLAALVFAALQGAISLDRKDD